MDTEIKKTIDELKSGKWCGDDEVPTKMIKRLGDAGIKDYYSIRCT